MKLKTKIENPTNAQGEPVDITARSEAADGKAFHTIKPGRYNAVVEKVEFETYVANYKGFPNPNSKDGKWTYGKLIPHLRLLNENGTIISRENIIIGVLEDGVPYRPDGDKTKPAIWPQAQYFLSALGLFKKSGDNTFELNFDTDHIFDRVVRVKTDVAGFVKGSKNYSPEELRALLTEVNLGVEYEWEDLFNLVAEYNQVNGLTDAEGKEFEEGVRLKTKNVVVNYFGLAEKDADEFYFDPDTQAVFVSEASKLAYDMATQETGKRSKSKGNW